MELGRQEPFCFPDRRRDPFDVLAETSNVLLFDQPKLTLESLERLLDEIGPLPLPFPWEDPDHTLFLVPPTPKLSELGIEIYWTDNQGRTRGPDGRVL
ncbi:hypothetical protein AOPFMNJM_2163 [Methylobacterium jeotgali]|jgi:hypothetical protein|uniref:Uncharacterized protein n=1 Tax=Methylobacterium jeotgali TaxID=381630 RepID=A0ABQ4SX89_9HYPH|nr:hypothetical protein AOPFMNJM_2163 [Methylobacterium jeotgali]